MLLANLGSNRAQNKLHDFHWLPVERLEVDTRFSFVTEALKKRCLHDAGLSDRTAGGVRRRDSRIKPTRQTTESKRGTLAPLDLRKTGKPLGKMKQTF